jgi:hypothetical protein
VIVARAFAFACSMQASVAPPQGNSQSLAAFLPATARASHLAWHFAMCAHALPTALPVACSQRTSSALSDVGSYAKASPPEIHGRTARSNGRTRVTA